MGKKKELSLVKKSEIILLSEEGYTQRQISCRLSVALGSVNKIINLYKGGHPINSKPRSGRGDLYMPNLA